MQCSCKEGGENKSGHMTENLDGNTLNQIKGEVRRDVCPSSVSVLALKWRKCLVREQSK